MQLNRILVDLMAKGTMSISAKLQRNMRQSFLSLPNLGKSSLWVRKDLPTQSYAKNAIVSSAFNACYHIDGSIVDFTALYRGNNRYINVPNTNLEISESTLEEAVYGGVYFDKHYGHFLTEAISRLWPLHLGQFLNKTWVFRVAGKPTSQCNPDFINQFMKALGFHGTIRFAYKPILVKHLIIPAPANINGSHCHIIFRNLTKTIGSSLINNFDGSYLESPTGHYYLSRSNLPNHFRKIANERLLEMKLHERGYNVISPENLSIPEQIYIFSNAKKIVGTVGSAFHNILLSQKESGVNLYLSDTSPPSTFHVLDKVCNIDATYIPCLFPAFFSFKKNRDCILDISLALKYLP